HLIGHLQSNKARDAVRLFDLIHSIDKYETAEKVSQEALAAGKIQKILVQVNTSGEESKNGCTPDDTIEICKKISRLKNIQLMGLMTVGPLTDNEDSIRKAFSLLRTLRDKASAETGLPLNELSMGMSGDFRIAIEEGATMIRIGSAIFGNRTYT
ncbi:MAG: YggS family pyridoxal phosphate-dependent enzyme, partial [Spirochaetota bacterium]